MNGIMNSMSHYFGRVPDQVLKKKWFFVLLFVLFTGACFYGLGRLKFDMTIESWFHKDDPTLVAFNEFHAQFGSEDGVYIVYKAKDGDVFSHQSLEAVSGIWQDLLNYRENLKEGESSPLEHVLKVTSLINAQVLTAEGDILQSKQLVGKTVPTDRAELERIRSNAKNQKMFPKQYFSEDMLYGGIYIETDFGAIPVTEEQQSLDLTIDDMSAGTEELEEKPIEFQPTDMLLYVQLNEALKEILNKPEYAGHLEYYAVGNTPASEADAKMVAEMGNLYMAALIIMIFLLWVFFRSLSGMVWPVSIVLITTIWTLGLAGLLGFTITAFVMLTVLLILTVGMADAVHILSGYLFFRNAGEDHPTALRSAFRKASIACFLTSATTIIGLSALYLSDIVPVQVFAFMSVSGVVIAFLLTVYLLPLLLNLWSPVPKVKKRKSFLPAALKRFVPNLPMRIQRGLDKIVPVVEKRPLRFVIPFFAVFVLCIYGSFSVRVNSDLLDQYPEESRFSQSIHLVDEKMAGTNRMVIYLDIGKPFAIQDPMVMTAIDDLQQKFEEKYKEYVVMTNSIANVVKDASQKLNEGREEMYAIPSDESVLSQTLFMFNNANPEDRKKLVDDNYQKSNITISFVNAGTYEYNKIFDEMKKDIYGAVEEVKQKYPDTRVSITGIFALAMMAADYLTITALKSFGIAFVVISCLLFLIYGSFKAGLISLVPNMIPAILTFGLLGLFNISLDFYTMMLAPIIIGISVDDTIHFMTHYRHHVLKTGDIPQSLIYTLKEAGQGVVFTSLILGLGFGIMSIASAAGTSNMGKFGAISVFAGLLNDLFLLPGLILLFKLKFKSSEPANAHYEVLTKTKVKESV